MYSKISKNQSLICLETKLGNSKTNFFLSINSSYVEGGMIRNPPDSSVGIVPPLCEIFDTRILDNQQLFSTQF